MNMQKWVQEQIEAKVKNPLPILSFPSTTLMGVTVDEFINNSDMQAAGMKLIAASTNMAASLSVMDLSVEAEAFGSKIRYMDGEVPSVVDTLVKTLDDAKALVVPPVHNGRTGKYVQAVAKAVESINDRPVFGGMIGPFSLAGRMLDVSIAMMKCIREPETVHTILEKVTDFLVEYAKAFKAVGANGIVMSEPLVGLLSPKLAKAFSESYVKRIVDEVQDENFIVVYHNCGNTVISIIASIMRTGCAAYHFGNAIDIKQALELMPKNVLVMGNIDPARQFRNGTPTSVYRETQKLMAKCCVHPNFIISSGCDIPPKTDWKNIDAFFLAVKNFYRMSSIIDSVAEFENPEELILDVVTGYAKSHNIEVGETA